MSVLQEFGLYDSKIIFKIKLIEVID